MRRDRRRATISSAVLLLAFALGYVSAERVTCF